MTTVAAPEPWLAASLISGAVRREILRTGVYAALVFGLTWAAVIASRGGGPVAMLWAAGPLALAGVLSGDQSPTARAIRIGLFGFCFAAANLMLNPLPRVALFTAANLLELVTALWLVRRFIGARLDFHQMRGLLRHLGIVAALTPIPAGLFASVGLAALGVPDPIGMFQRWYLGHALGLAVVTPFALSVFDSRCPVRRRPWRAVEAAALLLLIVAAAVATFFAGWPTGFLVPPLLLLASVRFRVPGAATAVCAVAAVAVLARLQETAPAMAAGPFWMLQIYLLLGCVPFLLTAAVLDERDRLAREATAALRRAEAADLGKSRLLANVSHEVRTPLNAVAAFSEALLREQVGPLNPEQKRMLQCVVASAQHLVLLAENLTSMARAEALSPEIVAGPVDVRRVVRQLVEELQPAADRFDARLAAALPEAPLTAVADPGRTAQILTNLVTNAIRYAGGEITIAARREGDGRIRVEVRDHGPGVPCDRRDELFEPFNRFGKEAGRYDGTGIGLPLARRLAEQQGGALDFESAPGRGSCFWVLLPGAGER